MSPATLPVLLVLAVLVIVLPWPVFLVPVVGIVGIAIAWFLGWAEERLP